MEILNIWRAVKSRWLWVALCVLTAVGATALVLIVSGTKYVARNDLLITASGGGFGTTSEYVYNAERLSAARAPTYAQLIQNREVLTRTSARVGQGVTPDEIQDALDVRTTRDIPIVRIAVVDSDPRRAVAIATDLAEVFSDYASELELSDGVDVSVRPANIHPEVEVDGNIVSRLVLAAFFGLLVGVIAAALGERLGRRITTGRELEEMGADYQGSVKATEGHIDSWDDIDYAPDYRRLAAAVAASAKRSNASRLLVTGPGDPMTTSTVARGLAAYLAESGARTLYIDARAELADVAGKSAPGTPGLTDLLLSVRDLDEVAQRADVSNLTEIAIGNWPNQLESLLVRFDFASVNQAFDSKFDFTIVDGAAATVSPAGVAVTPLADGAVIVGVAGISKRKDVEELASVLAGLRVPVVGMTLCNVVEVESIVEPAAPVS